jgi:DNA repair protein RadD
LVQGPTGSGKGTLAAYLLASARAKGNPAWFLVHRNLLINDISNRLTKAGVPHGIVNGEAYPKYNEPIQLVSWLSRRKILGFLDDAQYNGYDLKPRLALSDECHQAPKRQLEIIQAFPTVPVIGLSATPYAIGHVYKRLIHGPTVDALTAQGHLVPCEYYEAVPFTDSLRTKGDDVDLGEWEERSFKVRRGEIIGSLVDSLRLHCQGRRTLIRTGTKSLGMSITQDLAAVGLAVMFVSGDMDDGYIEQCIRWLQEAPDRILVHPDLLSEGVDIPEADALIFACPTRSLVKMIQNVGRILRPAPWVGKANAVVLDHAGVINALGRAHDHQHWELREPDVERAKRKAEAAERKGEPRNVVCGGCRCIYSGRPDCPKCGWTPPVRVIAGGMEVRNGKLQKVKGFPPEVKRQWMAQLLAKQNLSGYAACPADKVYALKFKSGWVGPHPPAAVYVTDEVHRYVKYFNIRRAKSRRRF